MVGFRRLRRYSLSKAGARYLACSAAAGCLSVVLLAAESPTVIPDALLRLIADQLSVENSMKQTAAIAAHARYPNSQGFFDAAEYVAARAREYGLQNVHIERFPQRAPLWDELEASLEVTAPIARKITAVLAQHSGDADLTAE